MSPRVAWNWRGSAGDGGTSRCWWCGGMGSGERSAAAANSASVSTALQQHMAILTIQTTCRAQDGLNDVHDAFQALPDVGILGLDGLLLAQHNLQVMVRLLALELPYALVQAVNLRLGAFPYRALGFAVVCTLPCELLGSKVCDATRGCGSAALLRSWLARISLAIVFFRNRRRGIGFARGKSRHGN